VCVSTGVFLCALPTVSFGDFFRMFNSNMHRNTYSLRKHWQFSDLSFELMNVPNNIHSYVSPTSVL
jgi:hypothetical protein